MSQVPDIVLVPTIAAESLTGPFWLAVDVTFEDGQEFNSPRLRLQARTAYDAIVEADEMIVKLSETLVERVPGMRTIFDPETPEQATARFLVDALPEEYQP